MYRIFGSLVALVVLAQAAQAAAPKVSISAKLGGVLVSASATGTPLQGAGKYGPYALQVTGGAVNGRYVTLTGVIAAGGQALPFRLDGDSSTGAVRLTYQTAKGNSITLTGSGTVLIK